MYQAQPEHEREPPLLTIDFMGIGSDKEINTSTGSCSHHQPTNSSRSMQSCLRQIKPHMLHHLLFSNPEAVKTLELFPQHTPRFQSNCNEGDILDRQSPSITAQAASSYNGALNVFPEKAGNGNGLQQIYPESEKGVSSTSAGAGFTTRQCVETPRAQLPIAKKLSLQRFLQERKDRLNKLRPYTT